MHLTKAKEMVLAKLIGIANGIYGMVLEESTKYLFHTALDAIKNDAELDMVVEKILLEKRRLLENCFSCISPCGRTSDYHIHEIEDKASKKVKLDAVEELLEFHSRMEIEEIIERLMKLSF